MCGIAGFFDYRARRDEAALLGIAHRMSDTLAHRGPDNEGQWVDPANGVALGFRRLRIIDLSSAGNQPMVSNCARYVLIFNGEIYNHQQLRRELGNYAFRGHSDTEVMLAGFSRWGILQATTRFNGMFAFAVWDRERRSLTLGRDRLGEKPLYYGTMGGSLIFGSELKALKASPDFRATIDRDAVTLYMRHGYIPAPHSIYQGILKLPPGTLVEVKADAGMPQPYPYWSAREASEAGFRNPFRGSDREARDALHRQLRKAVGLRLEADVPFGAFLSGGIDSSLVVALMQAQMREPVRTFTIGFSESGYDEAPYARAVAAHLGTAHTELYVTTEEAADVIPLLASIYDEPFADSSQIPTFLLSRMARSHVTVILSGDGGDELFGGYSRYLFFDRFGPLLDRAPMSVRRALAAALESVPEDRWDALFRFAAPAIPRRMRWSLPGDKLHKLAAGLRRESVDEIYLRLVSCWEDPSALVIGGSEPMTALSRSAGGIDWGHPATRAMYLDSVTYLPDDILVKVDRAAMAVSLETRMPLLDHNLYEFAWSLRLNHRIRRGVGKYLLRQILHQYVPPTLVERPKMGFGVPIGSWLRGPLRGWAEDLLDPGRLRDQGLLRVDAVRGTWESHLAGHSDANYQLWPVLMLQAWLDAQSA